MAKVLGFGEILMRLSTNNNDTIKSSSNFDIHYGGAEFNVISYLQQFNHQTFFMTNLTNNSFGERITQQLNSYKINDKYVNYNGEKQGVYYLEIGNSLRASEVIYDRNYSTFYLSKMNHYKIKEAIDEVDLIHLSGISPALNEDLKQITKEIIMYAKQTNKLISYDSNYRSKLWSQADAGAFLKDILPHVDIIFLGILDLKYLLLYEEIDLQTGYERLKKEYPNLKYIASTTRKIKSAKTNTIIGNLFTDKLYQTKEIEFEIIDRVGTGDAFSAGILNGILKKFDHQKTLDFAVINNVHKHFYKGDQYPLREEYILEKINSTDLEINR
ncbi:MAG: sugar kinase [Mycoplasmatales bacterium]